MKPWRIRWAGSEWTDDTVTVAHLGMVALVQGRDRWDDMTPWGGPMRLVAWLTALLAVELGSLDEARSMVADARAVDLFEAITDREV